MRNEPMRRNELPETCFSILPSSGQLIIIRCGERGYPDEKAQEQAAAFALEYDAAQQNTAELPAFLDMHLIEANLLDDGGRKHKRQEIFEYFQAHKGLTERTEFLKNSYNDIWVEVLTDGVRTGYGKKQAAKK